MEDRLVISMRERLGTTFASIAPLFAFGERRRTLRLVPRDRLISRETASLRERSALRLRRMAHEIRCKKTRRETRRFSRETAFGEEGTRVIAEGECSNTRDSAQELRQIYK